MGLLDGFFSDDPRQQAQVAFALGLLSGKGGKGLGGFMRDLGSAGSGALQTYSQASAFGDQRKENEQQRKMREMQMAEMQRGQDWQKAMSAGFQPGAPAQQSFAPTDMETPSQFTPAKPQGFDFSKAMGIDPIRTMQTQQAMQPKRDYKVVGNTLVGIQGDEVKPAFTAPDAAQKPPELIRYQQIADDPSQPEAVRRVAAEYVKKATSHAPAANVTTNVMPPREIFKDSLGLKKDFDSQPEVKGFKEVQGAWDQISTALQKPSPANDLAAATKFMKLLDPGSVVRESELMMAMQASGAWDRFMNTADRVLKGHKLTQEQRKDFYASGEELYKASLERYGQTVGQYEGIAKQYGLDSQFIQNAKPRQSNAANSAPKPGTVDGDYYFKGGNPADPKNWVKRK